jgi:sulfur transfer protein SufE
MRRSSLPKISLLRRHRVCTSFDAVPSNYTLLACIYLIFHVSLLIFISLRNLDSFLAVDAWMEARGNSLLDLGRLDDDGAVEKDNDINIAVRRSALLPADSTVDHVPAIPVSLMERVPGCTSVMHVYAQVGTGSLRNDSCVYLHGTSDARLTRGLLFVLRAGLRATPAIDLLEGGVSVEDIAALRFARSLPPQQQRGLRAIWEVNLS